MANTPLILRIRTKKGMFKIQTLTGTHTLHDLKKAVSDLSGIQYDLIKILKGYPPKSLESNSDSVTLTSLYLRDGDLMTIEEDSEGSNVHKSVQKEVQQQPIQKDTGVLLRKVVPADNSCLFTSVNYVVNNGLYDLSCQKSMRELIANTVKSDLSTYNEVFLGKKNKEYCEWIKNTSTWGGAIEIAILSKYYKIEICVVDIQTGRIDRFGEDQNYPTRVFILYDGIHFDPLFLEQQIKEPKIQTRFSTEDDLTMKQAQELGLEFKKTRQFTDVANFSLRCLVCQTPLKGQQEAQDHAKKTGHINFGEF